MAKKKKNIIHQILLYLWTSFGSPLTLVTFFGPLIVLKLSFLFLKENLRDNTNELFAPLKDAVLKNDWTEPMADFNVQFIVLIIVFAFAVYEVLSNFFGLIKEHKLSEINSKIKSDTSTLLFVLITVLIILSGGAMLIFGTFSTPENIYLFKENAEYYNKLGWGVHPPPFLSNIFWARVVIIFCYSPISNYLLRKKLPLIFKNSNDTEAA